ncbi:hypothetical protein BLGI_4481 [Brevibacillus laterosporus GI-9]|nr:hypothetical protein BLGI_4481 [Brevibacillus laterosporus GI-9]
MAGGFGLYSFTPDLICGRVIIGLGLVSNAVDFQSYNS